MSRLDDYLDDPKIEDSAALWRRICPDWITFDEQTKKYRVTSQAFQNSTDGTPMSVHLAALTSQEKVLKGRGTYSLVSLTAGFARNECNQKITPDPLPDDPSHTFVVGDKPKPIQRKFAKNCTWVVRR